MATKKLKSAISELTVEMFNFSYFIKQIIDLNTKNKSTMLTDAQVKIFFAFVMIMIGGIMWFSFGMEFFMRSEENLPKEYAEVFATPLQNVHISNYWNSRAGHGIRFSFTVKSNSPLQLKNPDTYKEVTLAPNWGYYSVYSIERDHPEWNHHFTALDNEKNKSGGILVVFNQSRTMCAVRSSYGRRILGK